ncbi:SDR family NAD(P)-dependent oxidoreductase [Nocardia sp. CA-129566]|uniref:SDR family NAD(P)-dependent oxidoreductase n=1 Tax=Nocardia sp. CA-129566 TaxID=3239976 RepID=UPI003D991A69
MTGAGSGIGRALTVELSRCGAVLSLADRDEIGVAGTRELCDATTQIMATRLDVGDRVAVSDFAASTADRFGRVDMVVNCAGILHVGSVASSPDEHFDAVMRTNFWGVVHGTKAFLPHLVQAGPHARIVNVSSALGLVGVAGHGPYVSAKFAVRGFTESLRADLAETDVKVTCVYPGAIRTPIARSALLAPGVDPARTVTRFEQRLARTDVDAAARTILAGAERGKPRVLIGADAWLAEAAARVAGPHYARVLEMFAKL